MTFSTSIVLHTYGQKLDYFTKVLNAIYILLSDPPSRPTGPVTFDNLTDVSVTVGYLPPEDDGGSPITHYTVSVSVDFKDFIKLKDTPELNVDVENLDTDEPHVFKITASNKVGESPPLFSEQVIPESTMGRSNTG